MLNHTSRKLPVQAIVRKFAMRNYPGMRFVPRIYMLQNSLSERSLYENHTLTVVIKHAILKKYALTNLPNIQLIS